MNTAIASFVSSQRLALIEQARSRMLGGAGGRTLIDPGIRALGGSLAKSSTEPSSSAVTGRVTTLDPVVERSWRRCLERGQEPQAAIEFQAVTPAELARSRDASHALLDAAAPVIESLARAMLHTRYFAILTDARGTALQVHGLVDTQDPMVAALARTGVDLSEAAIGTTAIGATLFEQQPMWLHRGEHFFQQASVFSCAGAPIFGPDGTCFGMLDLTGVNVPEQPALKNLVAQSARSIENALTLALPHALLLRLNWPGRVLGDDSDGLVCVDADGGITGMNRPAADMLNAAAFGAPWHADQLFALPFAQLFDAATQHRGALEVPLWSGLRLLMLAQQSSAPLHGAGRKSRVGHAVPLKDHETWTIRKAVEDARGNVLEAARALGISRATVYRRLQSRKPGR